MSKYVLRRQILEVVRECEPACVTFGEIAQHPDIAQNAAVDDDRLQAEIMGLVERGYLKNLRPGRRPLYRITPKGRGQLDMEEDLEEYVWGESASRFAE